MNDTSGAGMTVNVQGQQWTWIMNYPKEDRFKLTDGTFLRGAQELHIPVNMKVHIQLSSKDVIHSFWVPNIGGKKDAVPGRATDLWIQADRARTRASASSSAAPVTPTCSSRSSCTRPTTTARGSRARSRKRIA